MFFNLIKLSKKYLVKLIPDSDCLLCCEKVPAFAQNHSNLICQQCHDRLPTLKSGCPVCAMPSISDQTCGACLKESPYFHKTVSAFHYETPINQFISQLKFNGRLEFTHLLANYLLKTIRKNYDQQSLPDLIIPVPLHDKKISQRGFNQSHIIARLVAKSLRINLDSKIIERVIKTRAQAELDAIARQKNLKGAFKINLPEENINKIKGKTIAIIDDVMTTGTTVNELSKELIKLDVKQLHIWCVARAYTV